MTLLTSRRTMDKERQDHYDPKKPLATSSYTADPLAGSERSSTVSTISRSDEQFQSIGSFNNSSSNMGSPVRNGNGKLTLRSQDPIMSKLILEPQTSTRQKAKQISTDYAVKRLRFNKLGKLYGRDHEVKALQRLFSDEPRCFVTIEGASGTGKSALAASLKSHVARAGGFHVSGKFDWSSSTGVDPYSAIKQAMTQLLAEVVELGTKKTACRDKNGDKRYVSIRERLLGDVQSISILSQILPKIQVLLSGNDDDDDEDAQSNSHQLVDSASSEIGGGKKSVDRLNFAFRVLIQAVTQSTPLVLVVDDLQWADKASIDLIKSWITDIENPRLMIIGCYRSNMINEDHLVWQTLQDIRVCSGERKIQIEQLELGDLDFEAAHEMISEVLNLDMSKTQILVDIVYHKTLGNVFFLIQFMLSLVKEDLLTYQPFNMSWTWNDMDIKENTMATNNVVDLMKEKLLQSKVAPLILPLAACLGSQFTLDSICIVMTANYPEKEEVDIRRMLEECELEGFLEANGIGSFGFVHDRVQEAALGLVDQEELVKIRYRVGDALYTTLPSSDLDELIFIVTNLLNTKNKAVARWKQLEIAKLNYRAGSTAVHLSAFEAATGYFQQAHELLPPGHWATEYHFSLEVYTSAAEAAYCCGKFDVMQGYCDAVLEQQNVSQLTRMQIFNLLIDAELAMNEHGRAIDLSYKSLKEAGVEVPRNKLAIVAGMITGLMKFRRRPQKIMDAISKLPITSDAHQKLISKGIDKLGRIGYLAGQPELLALCCLVNLKRCFRHGVTPHTPLSMSLLAFLVTCVSGDFKTGLEYGDLSLTLLQRVGDIRVESITVFTVALFVHHWTKPYQALIETVLGGYRIGMRTGDIEPACYCSYYTMYLSFLCARPLPGLEDDVMTFSKQMHDFSQQVTYWYILPLRQAIRNLLGKGSSTSVLSGDDMDDIDEEDIWKLGEDKGATKAAATILKIDLAAFFGEFEVGANLAIRQGEKACQLMVGLPNSISCRFAGSLCLFACARSTGSKRMEKLARKYRSVLKGWLKQGNPNIVALLSLLDAEALAIQCKTSKTKKDVVAAYQAATRMNGRHGMIHVQALCNERLAAFHLEQGETTDAEYLLEAAIQLYVEWGASAKVLQLQEKLREIR